MYVTDSSRAGHRLRTRQALVTVERAGVRVTAIDPTYHTLDIYLRGAVSEYACHGERSFAAPCPPDSYRFLHSGSVDEIRTARSGTTLRVQFTSGIFDTQIAPGCAATIDGTHRYDDGLIGAATILVEHLERPGRVIDRAAESHGSNGTRDRFVEDTCRVLIGRLAYCLSRDPETVAFGRPTAVQQAIEFIESNLHRALTLERVADTVNLSQYYFARLFRREMNTSLQRYVISRRVARARELLVRSEDPLSDIAYRVGFGSQSHMTTLFKKYAGRTPGQVRRASALRVEARERDATRSA